MQHSYAFEQKLMENYQAAVPFNTSSLNVNLESFFFTIGWLWSRELRLTIPWQILNVLVRWGDHRVGSADKHASSGRCKPHGRIGTGKGTGLCRLALRSSELETGRRTKQKTIALPREEVEHFRDRAKLGVDHINDMVLDLLPHCYRWSTARILIVARRLGGLKTSNNIVNGKGSSESVPVPSHTVLRRALPLPNHDKSVHLQEIRVKWLRWTIASTPANARCQAQCNW
ncbi:BQ5605_C027g10433 [Microbotryum silenes-dioicae]|uniref:BQ5605_C027g10433 protein n=1 Tax=Microbotryum silenes-dioicae TaxID=796604 RepID=A0A2X0PNK3_9BASI|nr:BQ5605_C027g10433 [Microbotryum silenes-dioicae]